MLKKFFKTLFAFICMLFGCDSSTNNYRDLLMRYDMENYDHGHNLKELTIEEAKTLFEDLENSQYSKETNITASLSNKVVKILAKLPKIGCLTYELHLIDDNGIFYKKSVFTSDSDYIKLDAHSFHLESHEENIYKFGGVAYMYLTIEGTPTRLEFEALGKYDLETDNIDIEFML